MPIEFPLASKTTTFGRISDPQIPVAVRAQSGSHVFKFLLDTGADFTLVPGWVAGIVGSDFESLPPAAIVGVEQGGLQARFGRLPIRIAGRDIDLRCFFIDRPDALFILGRAHFLDQFVLTIDQPRGRILLEAVDG